MPGALGALSPPLWWRLRAALVETAWRLVRPAGESLRSSSRSTAPSSNGAPLGQRRPRHGSREKEGYCGRGPPLAAGLWRIRTGQVQAETSGSFKSAEIALLARRRRNRLRLYFTGNFPCHVLATHFPLGRNPSPRTYIFPDKPPRAANSNSASVGKRLPAHFEYASASGYAIWTTGYFSFPSRSLLGPCGCRQSAPLHVAPPLVVIGQRDLMIGWRENDRTRMKTGDPVGNPAQKPEPGAVENHLAILTRH